MSKRNDTNERHPRGFYPTPWAAVKPLMDVILLGGQLHPKVIEPCAGNGQLCAILTSFGCEIVWASDIVPQHKLVHELDAAKVTDWGDGWIITNPPWPEPRRNGEPTLSILWSFVRGCSPAGAWVLLPADFMHNVYAAEIMAHCDHIISVGRVKWIPGSEHEGFDNAAWYHFQRHPDTEQGIRFTPRQPKKRAA